MNIKELADKLDGRKIGEEITEDEVAEAVQNNLVVVFGASDDLMEFRGKIVGELGAYEGTTAKLTKDEILYTIHDLCIECPCFRKVYATAMEIKAVWHDEGNPCWTYETDIPHETFDIMEDGEIYCVGIVFSIEGI